jgi:hypothetical protein
MTTPPSSETPNLFDVLCDRLEALSPKHIADTAKPFALVYGESALEWFASFAEAAKSARARFEPETYAIGNPIAEPDYVPMVFVRQPLSDAR